MKQICLRTLRVSVFLLSVAAILLYVDYRVARATVVERLIGLGGRMAAYLDDDRATEAPRHMQLNGVKLHFAVGRTMDPPVTLRSWYRQRYAAEGKGLDALRQKLIQSGKVPPDGLPPLNSFMFGNDRAGGMAALDFGDETDPVAVVHKLMRSENEGGAAVRLRYLYYQREGDGGCRYLTVWTDESFRLSRLVPGRGQDAEGEDPPQLPRFPGSQRTLFAQETGLPQRIFIYEVPAAAEAVRDFYRAAGRSRGWREDEPAARVSQRGGEEIMRLEGPAGIEYVIGIAPAGRTDKSVLTVLAPR